MSHRTRATVALEWVLHDGAPVHVSTFASLAPRQRPEVTCPVCLLPVVMRLGSQKRHHAAHKPEADCAVASDAESALHLNCKLHLAAVLRTVSELEAELPCRNGSNHPTDSHPPLTVCAFANWDEVLVEVAVGSRRPDILLLRHGKPIGAVEVHVTHAVSAEKANDLANAGVSWLEIRAAPPVTGWLGDGPLAAESYSQAPRPLCLECVIREAQLAEAALVAQQRAHRHRQLRDELDRHLRAILERERDSGQVVRRIRIVDVYYPSKKRYRDVFSIVETRHASTTVRHELHSREACLATETGPPSRASWLRLRDKFEQRILSYRHRAIVDLPMDWLPLDERFGRADFDSSGRDVLASCLLDAEVTAEGCASMLELCHTLTNFWCATLPRRYDWGHGRRPWVPRRGFQSLRWNL